MPDARCAALMEVRYHMYFLGRICPNAVETLRLDLSASLLLETMLNHV